MLLTNMAVAEQVAVNFPEQALLRRHDTPLERRLVRNGPLIRRWCSDPLHRKDSRNEQKVSGTRLTSLIRVPS